MFMIKTKRITVKCHRSSFAQRQPSKVC